MSTGKIEIASSEDLSAVDLGTVDVDYVPGPEGETGVWMDYVFLGPEGEFQGLVNINTKVHGPVSAPQIVQQVHEFREAMELLSASGLGRPASPTWSRMKRIEEGAGLGSGFEGPDGGARAEARPGARSEPSASPGAYDTRFFFQEKDAQGRSTFLPDEAGGKHAGLQWTKATEVSFLEQYNPKQSRQVRYAVVKTVRTPTHGVKAFDNEKGYSPCAELQKIVEARGLSVIWNGPPLDLEDQNVFVQIAYKMRQEAEARMRAEGAKFLFSEDPADYTPSKVVYVSEQNPVSGSAGSTEGEVAPF